MPREGRRRPAPLKGLASGVAGGIAGSLAMSALAALVRRRAGRSRERASEPVAAHAAVAIANRAGYRLSPSRERAAGSAVHYGFGTLLGGAYGAAVEYVERLSAADGLPFGAGLMLMTNEVAAPALGLSPPPSQSPPSRHAYWLASHLLYGAACELTRRGVRRLLT